MGVCSECGESLEYFTSCKKYYCPTCGIKEKGGDKKNEVDINNNKEKIFS